MAEQKRKNKKDIEEVSAPFLTQERVRTIMGIACIVLSIVMFIGFGSYFFTWQEDQDKVLEFSWRIIFSKTLTVSNAMGRLGLGPVGVFKPESGEPLLHTLTPYKSLEQYIGTADALRRDAAYVKAAEAHANAPATDPAYDRIESSLLLAFEGMPKLQAPGNGSRLFEFRIYESHSRKANKKKIEMFNVGEIDIFRRTGLTPVFFGESIIGTRLPNLSYMLVFKDRAERDKNWGVFVKDPAWDKLKSTPGYADKEIVSKITNVFLVPAACSQI